MVNLRETQIHRASDCLHRKQVKIVGSEKDKKVGDHRRQQEKQNHLRPMPQCRGRAAGEMGLARLPPPVALARWQHGCRLGPCGRTGGEGEQNGVAGAGRRGSLWSDQQSVWWRFFHFSIKKTKFQKYMWNREIFKNGRQDLNVKKITFRSWRPGRIKQ